jgi:hypothetical protein
VSDIPSTTFNMYIEDHTFQIPSPPFDGKVINPLVLTSPNASAYRRQASQSSIASSLSDASTSTGFFSYSPPPSPHSSYFSPVSSDQEDEDEVKVSKSVDLHARAQLLLSLLYTKSFPDESSSPIFADLIREDCTFEVEHFDASTSTITSRDEYLRGWSKKVSTLGEITSRVRECVVDESQRKVWVVNELSCMQGERRYRKESVDMLSFDEAGKMQRREGWMRAKRRGAGDE